jgi:hypothetical protein
MWQAEGGKFNVKSKVKIQKPLGTISPLVYHDSYSLMKNVVRPIEASLFLLLNYYFLLYL